MTSPLQAALEAMERRLDPRARAPLAVAFSGGGDSTALLLAARAWTSRHGRALHALHVDHGLQAASSDWANAAGAACARLGVSFRRLEWRGQKPVSGLPAAARAARHRLIADAARDIGASVVLVGHTFDDQLENAVMRGSGAPVGALAEWSPSPVWPEGRGLFHFRPLLTQRRTALRGWLGAEGLGWIDDPANADPRYARARARPRVQAGEGQAPPPAADIRDLASACRWTRWGGAEIDRARLSLAPREQALRLLQIALACVSGQESLARPARACGVLDHIVAGDRFTTGLAGARIEASDAIRLCREAGEGERGGLRPLTIGPGETAVWDGRFEIGAGEAVHVQAVRGQASRLGPADTACLKAIWPSARPSAPLLTRIGQGETTPRLALAEPRAHIEPKGMLCRMLGEARFAAATGLLPREQDLGTIAYMAVCPTPSYVDGGL